MAGVRYNQLTSLLTAASLLTSFMFIQPSYAKTSHSDSSHKHKNKHHLSFNFLSKKSSKKATDQSIIAYSPKHHHHFFRKHKGSHAIAFKPRYAYPLDFFLQNEPASDPVNLSEEDLKTINNAFHSGIADDYKPAELVQAGVFQHYPLVGSIFKRREEIKYIILHSTETGIPVSAQSVINSWNHIGKRHPGAQYIVERDGTIYQTLDPAYGSVHVNIFKTLPGINNDNSIGIEMNHTGKQEYPFVQKVAVAKLVTYLQHRYAISSENVITHRYAQQGDHKDPVNFDLNAFLAFKEDFRLKALATKKSSQQQKLAQQADKPVTEQSRSEQADFIEASVPAMYIQIHGPIKTLETSQLSEIPEESSVPLPGKARPSL